MFIAHEVGGLALGLYLHSRQPKYFTETWYGKLHRDWSVPFACGFGSFLPDLPLAINMTRNLANGLPAEGHWYPMMHAYSEAIHNFFLWLALFLLLRKLSASRGSLNSFALYAFTIGGLLCHVSVDMLTHGRGQEFIGCNYFWPLPLWIAQHIGVMLYRTVGGYAFHIVEIGLCAIFSTINLFLLGRKLR